MDNIHDPNVWSKFYVNYGEGLIKVYKLSNGQYQMGSNVGLSDSFGKTRLATWTVEYIRLCDTADSRVENLLYSNREQFELFYDESKDPYLCCKK